MFDEAPSVEGLTTDNDQEGSDDDSDYDSDVRPQTRTTSSTAVAAMLQGWSLGG